MRYVYQNDLNNLIQYKLHNVNIYKHYNHFINSLICISKLYTKGLKTSEKYVHTPIHSSIGTYN